MERDRRLEVQGVAMRTREEPPLDTTAQDCDEFVPAAASVDTGQPLELSVMLLLDGVDASVASQLMARAAQSYAERNIQLVLERTQKVNFISTTSELLIEDAKLAHEMGHLMGAHHHYANCVEGSLTSDGPRDVSPCTLMFNAVNFASLSFGTLEGTVVRGHAVNYAAP